ncbi:class I SAM-dependent methyltransferase [Diaphorobacter sp. LR2014-1]|uniref:class I SAM-dependent methyltransferase n=1 Tax=Diaphorobacter sp. LR2014-1 TaxID=1933219 RepID=UPI000CDAC603|nr:class I SAM-dependent methyltransferase [Diaphorobacter sp. LR2014-1]POR11614.1 SAM-dependent methyltransferase [Diaphorobacter sp. LR2014-1]
MAYSDITFKDKNPIKRWLQSRRLVVASRIADRSLNPQCVLDFGAGNGELCKLIALQFPKAKIVCYEPTSSLMAEAKDNLADLPQVSFCSDLEKMTEGSVDLIFCLEVFEHLPKAETQDALWQFNRLLSSKGKAVIGVPVEVGIPALYKGIFRMTRRFGAFDASIKNILLAALYSPPKDRPVAAIAPGFAFHYEHMGFDYRKLQALVQAQFRLQQVITSPFSIFGPWLNPEVNFLVQKVTPTVNSDAAR